MSALSLRRPAAYNGLPKAAPSYLVRRCQAVRRDSQRMTLRVRQDLLDCAIYFYVDEASARAGESAGASGFLLGLSVPGGHIVWAVTNRHVIKDGGWTIRLNTVEGSISTIDTIEENWFLSEEDDLAIMPISLSKDIHKFKFIADEWLLLEEDVRAYDIGPGDPRFVVGRFVNHDGVQRNTPTARFGQIAQSPGELVEVGGYRQESFLVEIRSIGGYSGSPVFVYLDERYYRDIPLGQDRHGNTIARGAFPNGPWLLGVDWCMVPTWENVCDDKGNELPNRWLVPANSGMMGVVPAWRLKALLDRDDVVAKRVEIMTIAAMRAQLRPSAMKTENGEA
jgi:hypothetical protein